MNFDVKARVLATVLTENKRSFTIKSDFKNVFEEFNIQEINKYFTTYNASAMKSAFNSENWFACTSHDLNLVQSHTFDSLNEVDLLNEVELLIINSKELVTYVKRSEIQHEFETTLKQSIEVRWDSRLRLLESIRDNYENLKIQAKNNIKIEEHLNHIIYELLCDLIKLLTSFHKYRLDFCYETKSTFHLVIPTKLKLLKECEHQIDDNYNQMS